MADETIIAGNPAVLRMKFERDGCKVTATALDIGEMPNAYYHGEYTIQKCDTIGNVVLTGRILSISPDGVVDPYMDARTKTYAHPELAHEAMASFAAAVDKMGRVHAPKWTMVTITMMDGSEFVGVIGDDRWVELPVGAAPQFSIRDNCEARLWEGEFYSNPAHATRWVWGPTDRFSIRPTEGCAWSDILTQQAEPSGEVIDYSYDAESDADFLIRIMHLRTCEIVLTPNGCTVRWPESEMEDDTPALSRTDAIRLATLIGGAA